MSLPITDVRIDTTTSSIERPSFSIPLFITSNVPDGVGEPFENAYSQVYTSLKGMTDAGFATTDAAYKAAQGFLSREATAPSKWVIGKHATGDADYAASLVAIEAETTDFYAFMADDHTSAEVQALSAAASSRQKVYFFSTQEADTKNTVLSGATDTAGVVVNSSNANTVGMYSSTADTTFPECNFWSSAAASTPDTVNIVWYYKKIVGVAAEDLTDTQIANLDARNLNYVLSGSKAGFSRTEVRTFGGKTTNNKWLHEVRLIHMVDSNLTQNITSYLVQDDPFNLPSVEGVTQQISKTLTPFVTVGSIQRFIVDDGAVSLVNGVLSNLRFTMIAKDFIITASVNGLLTDED